MGKWDKSICCMGDSLTLSIIYGVRMDEQYPKQLQTKLELLGKQCVCRNFGVGGNTTTQMLNRFGNMTLFGVPKIGIIFGGVNDPGASISQATTQSNIQSMIQSLKTSGCSKIIVVSAQYLNYTSGGDTLATPYAAYVPVRQAQQSAATTEGVVFADLYNYMRNRIVNGQDTALSASWHVAGTNQHLNAYGEGLVAQLLYDTIVAQGWSETL